MKSEIAAVAACGSLLLGGCAFQAEQTIDIDARASVNLTGLPAELPRPIFERYPNAVVIKLGNALASGMRIGHSEVVTAGHLAYAPDGSRIVETTKCKGQYLRGLDSSDGGHTFGGKELRVDKIFGYRNVDKSVPDVALLSTADNGFEHVKAVEIRDKPLNPGENVFIISYQPKGDIYRDPVVTPEIDGKPASEYMHPAIFGGVVLGRNDDGRIEVATGLRSYGAVPDDTAVSGTSGAAMLDETGKYVADIVESVPSEYSAIYEESQYNIDLTPDSDALMITKAIAEPMTPAVLNDLRSGLSVTPSCE